ncbi:MAG: hypothetical protein M0026_14235 [Nocardiopsaceae bacterium]|nr:hypothetical protein [Nocardiopsaceae bacterium]
MGWERKDDIAFYADAALLQHRIGPRWLVFWGPGSRRFWAFRRGAPHPLILSAPDTDGLYQQIQQTDLRP